MPIPMVRIEPQLMAQCKKIAKSEGRTIQGFIEMLLRRALANRKGE